MGGVGGPGGGGEDMACPHLSFFIPTTVFICLLSTDRHIYSSLHTTLTRHTTPKTHPIVRRRRFHFLPERARAVQQAADLYQGG